MLARKKRRNIPFHLHILPTTSLHFFETSLNTCDLQDLIVLLFFHINTAIGYMEVS